MLAFSSCLHWHTMYETSLIFYRLGLLQFLNDFKLNDHIYMHHTWNERFAEWIGMLFYTTSEHRFHLIHIKSIRLYPLPWLLVKIRKLCRHGVQVKLVIDHQTKLHISQWKNLQRSRSAAARNTLCFQCTLRQIAWAMKRLALYGSTNDGTASSPMN